MKKLSARIAFVTIAVSAALPALAAPKPQPPKQRISMADARKAAKASFGGEVKSEELEFEGGKWIYSFDLAKKGNADIQEVQIDALNGTVVSSKSETPAAEQREATEKD
jgi:uncharacterized membrane protein YkoI